MGTFTSQLKQRASERILTPLKNTCAITIHSPKTAALIFDKVFTPLERGTEFPYEVAPYASKKGRLLFSHLPGTSTLHQRRYQGKTELIGAPTHAALSSALAGSNQEVLAQLCKDGFRPILCEPHPTSDETRAGPAHYEMVVACISNLDIIDEERLTWKQVLEFRKDSDSQAAVMRFLAYLGSMEGKSLAEIQHKLATLYNKRHHALRKFGIYTKTITESAFALSKESLYGLIGAGAGMAALDKVDIAPHWALLVAGVPIANSMIASVKKVQAELVNEGHALAFHSALIKLSERTALTESNADEKWKWSPGSWTH